MSRAHRHDARLAAGSALDDLGPDEAARWEALRAACPVCRELERALDGVLAELALAAPNRVPPPGVLDGIRTAIAADAQRASR